MGRRDKRLARIARLVDRRRIVQTMKKLGAKNMDGQLKRLDTEIENLSRAQNKEKRTTPERHPLHDHPAGIAGRITGDVAALVTQAEKLSGLECREALDDAEDVLRSAVRRGLVRRDDHRVPKLYTAMRRAYWIHGRDDAYRAAHFHQQTSRRRQYNRINRRHQTTPAYRDALPKGRPARMWPRARLGYRDRVMLRSLAKCRCWLCENVHLFNKKTGRLL
jgi:hypothetical protein